MSKKSKNLGKNTLDQIEVQNISNLGMWLLIQNREYFMPFTEFPWFLNATIKEVYNIEFLHEHHLHWPDLDIDIDIESLKNPDLYPLKFSA